jgi:hypothetical protein
LGEITFCMVVAKTILPPGGLHFSLDGLTYAFKQVGF